MSHNDVIFFNRKDNFSHLLVTNLGWLLLRVVREQIGCDPAALPVSLPKRPGLATAPVRMRRRPSADCRPWASSPRGQLDQTVVNHHFGQEEHAPIALCRLLSLAFPHNYQTLSTVTALTLTWSRRRAMFPDTSTDDVGDSPPTMPLSLPAVRSEGSHVLPFRPKSKLWHRCLTRAVPGVHQTLVIVSYRTVTICGTPRWPR